MDCHKSEYDKWRKSHHDHAMDVANDDTVLGDFNDAVLKFNGVTAAFTAKTAVFCPHPGSGRQDGRV